MTHLTDKYYEAIVISDEIDPNHAGAVRVKIIGVTEDLEDENQPFVFPCIKSMQAVPTKGSLLSVKFDDGDINMGKYDEVSAEKNYLPDEYVSEYPYVAVSNLGDDDFILVHNRRTKTSVITHPSLSSVTWDSFGAITHDSDNGYTNAGMDAINSKGAKTHAVLTEATVDPFTCTVFGNNVGNGGAYQGSEYLFVTHISKATVDAINGKVASDDENSTSNPAVESGGNELVTNSIFDADGNESATVEYYPSESFISRTDKDYSHIILATTNGNTFLETAGKITDKDNNYACHYLVGRTGDSPKLDAEREGANDAEKNSGFMQFVEIKNDVYYASNATIVGLGTANKNAVTIMLVGDGTSYTDYQYDMINKLIAHVKYVAKDDVKVFVTDNLKAMPPYETIGALDPARLNK